MVQPLLVSLSALTLATETVRSILKIDDVVSGVGIVVWVVLPSQAPARCHSLAVLQNAVTVYSQFVCCSRPFSL